MCFMIKITLFGALNKIPPKTSLFQEVNKLLKMWRCSPCKLKLV